MSVLLGDKQKLTMRDYKEILKRIQADERYQSSLDWGRPRKGHPEGTIRRHIGELERNVVALSPRLSAGQAQS